LRSFDHRSVRQDADVAIAAGKRSEFKLAFFANHITVERDGAIFRYRHVMFAVPCRVADISGDFHGRDRDRRVEHEFARSDPIGIGSEL